MTTDQTNVIAEALWGIAAAITASGPQAPQLTMNTPNTEDTIKGYGPTANPDAFRPALELLPIGAVAELDEPVVLDGPKAEAHGIPSGTWITRVEKHRHELATGHGSGFELYDGDDAPWYGNTNVVLEMGLSARDFSLPELEVSEVEELVEDVVNEPSSDAVERPAHYTAYPVEVIELTEHLNFCRGNAVKYIARAGLKDPATEAEDLRKARWYIDRELDRIKEKA